jgi:hypothetical protein
MAFDERIDPLPPPRCLAGFTVAPTADPGVELDTLVEEWPERFFAVACPCGGDTFTVHGHVYREKLLGIARLSDAATLICRRCGRGAVAFDPALHGFDVELDHFPAPGPTVGVLQDFACPACANTTFALVARFQVPAEVAERQGTAGDCRVQPEDLFSYWSLLGRCAGCQEWTTLQSVECA